MNRIYYSLLFLLNLTITFTISGKNYISLTNLIKEKKVNLIIKNFGKTQEYCVIFYLKNNTNDSLFFLIEPGRKLISNDTTYTDLLVIREIKYFILPNQELKVPVYSFSCQSKKQKPKKESYYTLGNMAPDYWITLAKHINTNQYPADAIQQAIWVLSDHHPLASIYASPLNDIIALRQLVAELIGEQVPWYAIEYAKNDSLLFTGNPVRVSGEINYYLSHTTFVTISVRDTAGLLIRNLMNEQMHYAGDYSYFMDIKTTNWKKKEYKLYLYENFPKVMKIYPFKLE